MTRDHKLILGGGEVITPRDFLLNSSEMLIVEDRPGYGLRGLIGEEAWARMHEPPKPPTWRERISAAWRCLRGGIGE